MRLVRTVSWILTFVAIGAAAAAWFTPRPDVDADMAGDIALRALEEAGIDDATVRGTPELGVHTRPDETTDGSPTTNSPDAMEQPAPTTTAAEGDASSTTTAAGDDASSTTTAAEQAEDESEDEIEVWIVKVEVGGAVIEMRIHDDAGQLVYVDDLIGRNRDRRLLDDEQWAVVSTYRDDEVDSWVGRNVAGSIAAGLIVVVGFLLAKRSEGLDLSGPQDLRG